MLKNWNRPQEPEEYEVEKRLEIARKRLVEQQIIIKEKKIPVLILFEGWGASGKGSIIGKVIKNMDPRFFKVATINYATEEEKRKPFLYKYFSRIPQAGNFMLLDSGWMEEITKDAIYKREDVKYTERIESIKIFERQLKDNGYLVIKYFLHIGKKEQKKRLELLKKDKNTKWRVSEFDLLQNKKYDFCMDVYDDYLSKTNQSLVPWYLIDAKSKKWAQLQVLEILVSNIDVALQNSTMAVPLLQNTVPLVPIQKLQEVSLNCELTEEEYREQLEKCQSRLKELHNIIYCKKIPIIIGYEGWDAAGKGGNIKRITEALDPRGFEVHPIASPELAEKSRQYLWRFWSRLPKTGHITIFDRTWYGRVMVERLEGFCSTNDWQRAYYEINEFEKELSDWGAIIIKFWVHIDKETQLERFTERENTPEKKWKITQEDWRNREKWDAYEEAVDEMLKKTNTPYAPWYILESKDKKYARIKALKIVIEEIEKRLEKK